MYFDENGNGTASAGELICSGSYAGRSKSGANDVFLTAGHCLPPAELSIPASAVLVSFDGDAGNGVSSPLTVSSYHQMPGFGRDLGDIRDLGILLLPAGLVPAGTPAVQLPTAGYLDQLKASGQLELPHRRPGRLRRRAGLGREGADAVRVRRRPPFGHVDHHRPAQGDGPLQPAAPRDRHRLRALLDLGSPQLDRGTLLVLSVTSGGNG